MDNGQRVGVELGSRIVRAVRSRRWGRPRFETFETTWNGDDLDPAVAALRERFGTDMHLAVAVALDALYVKRLPLPPLDPEDRRRAVALDAERFFPVRAEEVVVSAGETDLVFAARREPLERWIGALENAGTVERVEEAPAALARCCARFGGGDAWIVTSEGEGRGTEWVEVRSGNVTAARRAYGALTAAGSTDGNERLYVVPWRGEVAAAVGADLGRPAAPLPTPPGLDARYATALGAVWGLDIDAPVGLAPPAVERRMARRRRHAAVAAWSAMAAALLFGGYAIDRRRERVEERLDTAIAALRGPASEVAALQQQMDRRRMAADALADLAGRRVAPLEVLLAIARILPDDAFVRSVQGSGRDFQLDGYARDAAPLVPLFEESPEFEGVHFRGASNRVRLNDGMYDGFSLALHYAPPIAAQPR